MNRRHCFIIEPRAQIDTGYFCTDMRCKWFYVHEDIVTQLAELVTILLRLTSELLMKRVKQTRSLQLNYLTTLSIDLMVIGVFGTSLKGPTD